MSATWNLRMNPSKYETIVFRVSARTVIKAKRVKTENFTITTFNPDTEEPVTIPIKDSVKPILTYGAPVLWNLGAAQMKKLRKLERACLRVALRSYKSTESNYTHNVKNTDLYNEAKIPRIDNFWPKLTRDYFPKLKSIDNELIQRLCESNPARVKENSQTGFLQPQAFTVLKQQGVIQDHFNIPVLYHKSSHMSDKKILWSKSQNYIGLKYSKMIPDLDKNSFYRRTGTHPR
ncbi:Protein of unknown function [Cotesia congregata]|uniref:Uncharacterized protein n=1 Tax=Cotesia congregata TaxID=51543 RepID=A0A8J2EBU3_COTCN|nr:Protein of unknown function [Cotesia congregata]